MQPQNLQSKSKEPPQLTSKNVAALDKIFNWLCVNAIDPTAISAMAERLGNPVTLTNIQIVLREKIFYSQFQIFNGNHQQLFHIKQAWEGNYLREVLALHLATRVFDPELFVPDYLTGTYTGAGKKAKLAFPYIMTAFVKGKQVKFGFKKDPESPLWWWFGRHYFLHTLLSLYDVDPRHFLLEEEDKGMKGVKRIDLGLAFTKLDQSYDGFQSAFKGVEFEKNPAFQQGFAFEREKVLHNLQTNRFAVGEILFEFTQLEMDHILDFDPNQFCQNLITYWRKAVPDLEIIPKSEPGSI
ncbi:MAG: hypothetical protein RBG13Loki_2561 [Promethearchaeota archaeon CR_4]|nr:MAG: hypothetical protein RBG13Loki_2561 [Candidatus Lokiarchaeota archaeon CR_4]